MGLYADFLGHDGRLIHKWKHYFVAYEKHFSRFVNQPTVFFEIGVFGGGSLQMWKRYIGPNAQIVGIDIDVGCAKFEEDQIAVRIGNQNDTQFLQSVLDEFGVPDIVLDDGSHKMSDMKASFEFLYPRTAPNGVYFIEDVHTCYSAAFGGGQKSAGSFMEISKDLIDQLNRLEKCEEMPPPNKFTYSTLSMHFYPGCIVFERGRYTERKENAVVGYNGLMEDDTVRQNMGLLIGQPE